jgi:hypothetical protein
MFIEPSADTLLEGVIVSLQEEIMPFLTNAKAIATAAMMQSVLQEVRQLLPVRDAAVVDEHNQMTKVLQAVAAELVADGPEADRIRSRAATLGRSPDLPAPLDMVAAEQAHRSLSAALQDDITDLDVLQRIGNESADRALQLIRAHLAPRYARDVQTVTVGAGFLGRG